jgi:iron complex transport system substrate-binding protein
MRVVSLVPSATELLHAMGGGDLLVGRSHECDWPAEVGDLPVLTRPKITAKAPQDIDAQVQRTMAQCGSLYELDTALLKQLRPDVILLQDTCAVCSIDRPTLEAAMDEVSSNASVLSLNPHTVEDIFDDLLRLGDALERPDQARRAMVELRALWCDAQDVVNPYVDGPATIVIEWVDPLYVAGHWTPQLIAAAGGRQDLIAPGEASRIVTPEELLAMQVERLIVAPCGVPLDQCEAHVEVLRDTTWWSLLPAVMEHGVAMVDGTSSFSRPGPRLMQTHRWLTGWLQDRPAMIPTGYPWASVGPS